MRKLFKIQTGLLCSLSPLSTLGFKMYIHGFTSWRKKKSNASGTDYMKAKELFPFLNIKGGLEGRKLTEIFLTKFRKK